MCIGTSVTIRFRIDVKGRTGAMMPCMEIIISHQSALMYWRGYRKGTQPGYGISHAKPPTSPPDTRGLLERIAPGIPGPVHILVGRGNARKVSKGVISHVSTGSCPRGSIVKVDKGFKVVAPELCFLQMAGCLSFEGLLLLAHELCGGYVVCEESKAGYVKVRPLTSTSKLKAFVKRMRGYHGIKTARKVLRYTSDDAASPREAQLNCILTLPYRLGGFGFTRPVLNARIKDKRKTGKERNWYCDLFWREKRLAVEYDSDTYHGDPDSLNADSIRRTALTLLGIEVVTVTNRQVISIQKLKELACLLARRLGKVLRYRDPAFTNRVFALRRALGV